MSTCEYPELQVWNNAAFDKDESGSSMKAVTAVMKVSWSDMEKSDCSKENFSPAFIKSPVFVKSSSVSVKPLQSNGIVCNSQVKQFNLPPKPVFIEPCSGVLKEGNEKGGDERNLDLEIEELENEINRLSTRLKLLRLEKAEQNAKMTEKRGRIIPAKFMEKQSVKSFEGEEESSRSINRMKSNRRGLSLGPSEIYSGTRRTGISLGPSEIISGIGSRRPGKMEITPVQPIQSRRKSCFWKLQEIDEMKATRQRWNSLSVSPKSRKTTAIKPGAATTMGCKRPVKKEDGVIGSIQPKRLFKGGEKLVPMSSKKPLKPVRAVASRYNQACNGNSGANEARKRSLPENGKEEEEDKCGKFELSDMLPRIRTNRCCDESPRDSGPAKRVAELIGKKSFFCHDEEIEQSGSVCQSLTFADEEEEELES